MKAHLCGALLLALVLPGRLALAQAAEGCSHDVLRVDGTPVEVTLCVPPAGETRRKGEGKAVNVNVTETFSANGQSFSREVPLEFLEGSETSRTMDDVPLAKLGIGKSLHLTIGYRPGSVRLEHAMLLPGAINLK
jgi:hypothetical protein